MAEAGVRTFLHVGCGPNNKHQTTPPFATEAWRELRFDIDPGVAPDLVGTMTDMAAVPSGSVDAVYSSHNIEHLYPHEVPLAVAEFLRVLGPSGFAVITCPDLQAVAARVAEDRLLEPAYTSALGPIAPLDMLYGLRSELEAGNVYMAHRCGFTERVLTQTLRAGGFATVATLRRPFAYDLWALACKHPLPDAALTDLALAHFPR